MVFTPLDVTEVSNRNDGGSGRFGPSSVFFLIYVCFPSRYCRQRHEEEEESQPKRKCMWARTPEIYITGKRAILRRGLWTVGCRRRSSKRSYSLVPSVCLSKTDSRQIGTSKVRKRGPQDSFFGLHFYFYFFPLNDVLSHHLIFIQRNFSE